MSTAGLHSRRPVAVAVLTCAAVLALAGPLSTGAAAPSSTPRCATSKLVIWIDTQGQGALGKVYYKLNFTNLSGHTCSLKGYPGVSAVDLAGKQLGSPASQDSGTKVKQIKLANGASATTMLRVVSVGVYPTSTCKPVTAAGFRVSPPSRKSSKVVPFPFSACSGKGLTFLGVQAVKRM